MPVEIASEIREVAPPGPVAASREARILELDGIRGVANCEQADTKALGDRNQALAQIAGAIGAGSTAIIAREWAKLG